MSEPQTDDSARLRQRVADLEKDRERLDGDVRAASQVAVVAHALLDTLVRWREGAVAPRVVLATENALREALGPRIPAPAPAELAERIRSFKRPCFHVALLPSYLHRDGCTRDKWDGDCGCPRKPCCAIEQESAEIDAVALAVEQLQSRGGE